MRAWLLRWAAPLLGLAVSGAAFGQTPRVSIGAVVSEQSCTTYRMSAGSSAIVADRYGFAAASSWRTWLERDCVDSFPTIRASLATALAASGKVAPVPRGTAGSYVLSATISVPGTRTSGIAGQDFDMRSTRSVVAMNLTLRDPAGRTIAGALTTRAIESSGEIRTDGFSSSGEEDGRAVLTELEQGLALQAARFLALKLAPLRVIGTGPDGIHLNYGAPLLDLGTIVQVQTADGRLERFRVVAAGDQTAVAEPDGEAAPVSAGSLATVIEQDSAAANARTTRRVDLP